VTSTPVPTIPTNPGAGPTPSPTSVSSVDGTDIPLGPGTDSIFAPSTGDGNSLLGLGLVAGGAALAGGLLLRRRRSEK